MRTDVFARPGRTLSAAWLTVVCVLAINLFVGLLTVRHAQQSYTLYQDRAAISSRNLAQILAQNVGSVIGQIDQILLAVDDETEREMNDGAIDRRGYQSFLARQARRLPGTFGLAVTDADGRLLRAVNEKSALPTAIADEEWFVRLRDTAASGLIISRPERNNATGSWVIVFARRLSTPDDGFAGVVMVPVDIIYFTKMFSAIDLGSGGSAILSDSDGKLISRFPVPADLDELVGRSPPSPTLGRAIAADPIGGSYHPAVTIDGIDRFLSYQRIRTYPLYVLVGLAADDILAPWRDEVDRMTATVVGFSVVTLLLSLVVLTIWNRRVHVQKTTEAILSNTPVGIAIVSAERIILRVNKQYCEIYGMDEQQLIGQAADILYSSKEQSAHVGDGAYPLILAGGTYAEDMLLHRKNGETLWIHLTGRLVDPRDATAGVVWAVEDISERKAAEATIKRQSNLYAALSQCNQAIVRCTSEDELFPQICRDAVRFGGMMMAWIGLVDSTSRTVTVAAADGAGKDILEQLRFSIDAGDPYGGGPSGQAIRNDTAYWCQDFLQDPATAPWHEHGRRAGWKAAASLPLHKNGAAVGCLTLYSDTVDAFDADARGLLTEMAADIGFALDNFTREAERRQAAEALRIAATAFDSQESMAVTDSRRVILQVNKAFVLATGYSSEESVGQSLCILRSDRHDQAFYDVMWAEIACNGSWQGEAWSRNKDGGESPAWVTITAVTGNAGEASHYVIAFTDTSRIKASEEEVKYLAYYDPLTALPNRRLLLDRLSQALAGNARSKHEGALLFIDLDNFKTVNDTLGHDKGDQLLQQVAQRLGSCLRAGDTVARLGGDEFVVMLEDLGGSATSAAIQAESVCEKILAGLAQPYQLATHECYCTASIGVTLFADQRESREEVLKQADLAMYQAKAAGRNAMRFFDQDMQAAVSARAAIEADLRFALRHKAFYLAYQPQVNAKGQVTGAEALLRWPHAERGLIPPDEFIPVAEETGLILPLGRWVLETACRQLVAWHKQAEATHLTLSVNVSARQFRQADFVEQVLGILDETGADPRKLKLELTESLVLDDVGDIVAKMTALRTRGVSFALDDFGTGYSSLSYLKRLPLSQLKVDRAFVRDILTDPNDAALVRTVVTLARSMGLDVIAEGVETEGQRDFLIRNKCFVFQGYLFGRPAPIEDFAKFLHQMGPILPSALAQ